MGVYLLKPGTFQITTAGANSSTLSSIGGSSEPFSKLFHSNIIVESQDAAKSTFKGDLQIDETLTVSGSLLILSLIHI